MEHQTNNVDATVEIAPTSLNQQPPIEAASQADISVAASTPSAWDFAHSSSAISFEESSTGPEKNNRFITRLRGMPFASDLGLVQPIGGTPSWKPTWFRPYPLFGIAALCLSFACLWVSLGVLVASDGDPVANWYWQPTVYLAILTAISNGSINFALLHALPTAWWYKAFKGATIRDLQRRWEAGNSIFRAIVHGKHLSLLAVACFSAALVLLDGPLLQRASSVQPRTTSQSFQLSLPLSQEIPTGFGGFVANKMALIRGNAAEIIAMEWSKQRPILSQAFKCPDNSSCLATVHGPGILKSNCTSESWPLTLDDFHNVTSKWGPDDSWMPAAPSFIVYMNWPHVDDVQSPQVIELAVGRVNISNCEGEYVHTTCSLSSAIIEYDVKILGNEISFVKSPAESTVIAVANNTAYDSIPLPPSELPDTIGVLLMGSIFENVTSNISFIAQPGGDVLDISIHSANQMSNEYYESFKAALGDYCAVEFVTFADPTDDIITQIDNLFLRVGLLAATFANTTSLIDPGLTINQTVNATRVSTQNSYSSDLRWWGGAAAVQMLAILAILPIFWGYWRVGLQMTLSPLETANLFGAPMFHDVESTAGSRGVVERMGDKVIRLNVTNDRQVAMLVDSDDRRAVEAAHLRGGTGG